MKSLIFLTVSVVFAGASCTVSNPLYGGNVPDSDLGVAHDFGTGRADLSRPPATVDLSTTPSCAVQQRSCTANGSSAACVAGQLTPDRACTDSTCEDGYCVAPDQDPNGLLGSDCAPDGDPNDTPCQQQTNNTLACQPFVDPMNGNDVAWVCATAVGQGNSGVACTRGADCRSGFCGSNGTCYRACGTDQDCPTLTTNGKRYHCDKVTITVEGVMVNDFRSCVP